MKFQLGAKFVRVKLHVTFGLSTLSKVCMEQNSFTATYRACFDALLF